MADDVPQRAQLGESGVMDISLRPINPSCSVCQTKLIDHLRKIAAERDRTSLSGLLLQLFREILFVERCALFRYVEHTGERFIIEYARSAGAELKLHDAYRISPTRGTHLSEFPRLEHCVTTGLYVTLTEDGQHVCVLPVFRNESLHLLVELVRAAPFAADELVLAQSVLDFFRDHLALIDYAETDTLTGLLNRKTFDEHLDRVLTTVSDDSLHEANAAHPLRRHPQLNVARNWLAIIDIDHFKRINDTHGHLIGDEVLLLLAQLMGDAFRLDDQLFRFGGEEFVVVLQPTGLAEARKVLERFRERIEKHEFSIIGHMTVSLGFTEIQYFDNPLDLIDRADKALYYAKQHGRNRVENYEELFAAGLVDKGPERKKSDVELF